MTRHCLRESFFVRATLLAVFFFFATTQNSFSQPFGPKGKLYTIDELRVLDGKKIGEVTYKVKPIFEDDTSGSFTGMIYKTANSLKIPTKVAILQLEVGIKPGDTFNALSFFEAARRLRAIRYIRNVSMTPVVHGDIVDIEIEVQDAWTLIPEVSYSSGTGETKQTFALSESNLGGYAIKAEVLYRKEENQKSTEFVYVDERFNMSNHRLSAAYMDRNDGDRVIFDYGLPYRKLTDPMSWSGGFDQSDLVGSLYYGGEETYIFKKDVHDYKGNFSLAEITETDGVTRYSFGVAYASAEFAQATLQDYEDLNLDPSKVSNDPALLPSNRKFVGPTFGMTFTDPEFISLKSIDRFSRPEDYNLGLNYATNLMIASEDLDSTENAAIVNYTRGKGIRLGEKAFARGEIGATGRITNHDVQDTIIYSEGRYYNVLGPKYVGDTYIGVHTLAVAAFLDYGRNLDRDRQFTIGGDNALRGYKANTLSGDKAFSLNIEDRVQFIDDLFKLISLGGVAFIDIGSATYSPFGDMFTQDLYGDAGIGLRFGFPRSSGGSVLRVDFAVPFRDGPDGSKSGELRVTFGSGQLFSSQLRSERAGTQQFATSMGLDR